MMRLAAAASAVALYVLMAFTSSLGVVAGLAGLLPAAVAIVGRWRSMAVVAACAFLAVYTAALSIEGVPPAAAPALGLGLGLVVFLEAVDLSARLRGATVEGGVARAMLGRWIGLGGGVLVVATLAVAMAGPLVASLPHAVSPLVAAVGALACVVIGAALVRRGA